MVEDTAEDLDSKLGQIQAIKSNMLAIIFGKKVAWNKLISVQ